MTGRQLYDFDKIATKVCENYEQREKKIKEICSSSKIASLSTIYEGLKLDASSLKSNNSQSQNNAESIEEFAQVLKAFDEYPANLPKPKKPTQRGGANNCLNQTSLKDVHNQTVAAAMSINNLTGSFCNLSLQQLEENVPTPTETFRDYEKFKLQLQQLKQELDRQDIFKEYARKLTKFNEFAEQLEKLMPRQCSGEQAFNEQQQQLLSTMLANMEEMNFINRNQDLYQTDSSFNSGSLMARLDAMMEIIMYSLMAVSV